MIRGVRCKNINAAVNFICYGGQGEEAQMQVSLEEEELSEPTSLRVPAAFLIISLEKNQH